MVGWALGVLASVSKTKKITLKESTMAGAVGRSSL